jgi:hypothetical protein
MCPDVFVPFSYVVSERTLSLFLFSFLGLCGYKTMTFLIVHIVGLTLIFIDCKYLESH